jgi:hypothetical protein
MCGAQPKCVALFYAHRRKLRDTNEVQCQELAAVNFERSNWFEKWNYLPDPAAEQIQ